MLDHDGDFAAAAAALGSEGYGVRRDDSDVDLSAIVGGEDSWPEPDRLTPKLPPVMPFDPSMLPGPFRPWLEDEAFRMNCPIDFPAVSAMIAAAGVIGKKVNIRPKRKDDWTVVPTLWGVLIGRPSAKKSPGKDAAMRPLDALEEAAAREHASLSNDHDAEVRTAKLSQSALESAIKSAKRRSEDASAELEELCSIDTFLNSGGPTRKRYKVNDATVQALTEVLAENPNGVVIDRDELLGFLRSFDMQSQEQARAFFLEAWKGTGSFESDRIGRGNTRVESVVVSIIGTTQPGAFSAYISEALGDSGRADGFLQRFQLAVWPDLPTYVPRVDEAPNEPARVEAHSAFQVLDTLTPESVDANCGALHELKLPYLRFNDAAGERMERWLHDLENRVVQERSHEALEGHLLKYASLVPSLALITHLVEGSTGPVGESALDRAIRWAEYLESHARRLYGQRHDAATPAAFALARKIRSGGVVDGFTARDVYRPKWSGLATKGLATAAIKKLVDADWLRAESAGTGGSRKVTHRINPRVLDDDFAVTD
ncbi:MAG: YfjI family protein, partial [Myxococcota bacterium]